jgi:hypothetical protein
LVTTRPPAANDRDSGYDLDATIDAGRRDDEFNDPFCDAAACVLAAGFQDNSIGPIIITGEAPARGSNTWDHSLLYGIDERFRPLPNGASFRIPATRITGAGVNDGAQLEDYGVRPDVVHRTTRRDLLGANVDLLTAAWALLRASPRALLRAEVHRADGLSVLRLRTVNLDRVDTWIDGRPSASVDVQDTTDMPLPADAGWVRLNGFDQGVLKVVRKFDVRV